MRRPSPLSVLQHPGLKEKGYPQNFRQALDGNREHNVTDTTPTRWKSSSLTRVLSYTRSSTVACVFYVCVCVVCMWRAWLVCIGARQRLNPQWSCRHARPSTVACNECVILHKYLLFHHSTLEMPWYKCSQCTHLQLCTGGSAPESRHNTHKQMRCKCSNQPCAAACRQSRAWSRCQRT